MMVRSTKTDTHSCCKRTIAPIEYGTFLTERILRKFPDPTKQTILHLRTCRFWRICGNLLHVDNTIGITLISPIIPFYSNHIHDLLLPSPQPAARVWGEDGLVGPATPGSVRKKIKGRGLYFLPHSTRGYCCLPPPEACFFEAPSL